MAKMAQGGGSLEGKRIMLGVSGGIAAYKSAHLARELRKRGAHVRVVMTENATRFVTPLTFATLTQAPVCTSLWEQPDSWSMEHISNARWGDLLLVVPATANVIAKFAHGIADDVLTTLYLAWNGPVVVAPAMNASMYQHPAYRANETVLRERGVTIVDPVVGELACGEEGPGRLAETEAIIAVVERCLGAARSLEGIRVLVTAGPTREYIDPVRFLSNPSSGKMGFAVAEQAVRMGAKTTVVAGPASLPTPPGVERVDVVSAQQMCDAVIARCAEADIVIFAAAVADFAPVETATSKIKKREGELSLRLSPTPDIARTFGERKRADQVSVGFGADTELELESAQRKLHEKNFDLVFANPIGADETVFASDHNRGWLVGPSGSPDRFDRMSKSEVARRILVRAAEILRIKKGA